MTESELLIKIRTALESGGLDAAKSKLRELTETTKGAAGAAASNAAEMSKAHRAMAAGTHMASGLTQTLRGGSGALAGLTTAARGFFMFFGQGAAVVTAAIAGWRIGLEVQKALWSAIVESVKSAPGVITKTREELDRLAKVKMDALRVEIDGIASGLDATLSKLETAARHAETLRTARERAEVAEAETMPEGPERTRKVAAIRKRYADERLTADKKTAEEELQTATQARVALQEKYARIQDQITTAREETEYARSRGLKAAYVEKRRQLAAITAQADPELKRLQEDITKAKAAEEEARTRAGVLPYGAREAIAGGVSAEQSARRQEAQAAKEKAIAAIQERKRAEETAFEPRQKAAQEAVETAKTEAELARRRSEAFTPDPRLRGAKAAGQRARDEDLERQAARTEADLARAKKSLEVIGNAYEKIAKALEAQEQKIKNRDKNLPID